MLLGLALLGMNVAVADVQLAPIDQTICDDKGRREALYKAQWTAMQKSDGVPGASEAKVHAKEAVDLFFKRVDLLAAKAKWSSEQKGQFLDRVYNAPEVWALRHEPVQLIYRMLVLRNGLATDGEPQKCHTFVEFLKTVYLINSNDERQVAAMSKLLEAEAKRLGISLQ
jgi:hypothetical protein